MDGGSVSSGIEVAAARLRAHVLASENGIFLGKEADLLGLLGASRGTLRQVARILEREGLLAVRRGINGGYFAVRPDLKTVEAAVSGYLHTLEVRPEDAMMIASVLWVESLRKAADAPRHAIMKIVNEFSNRLASLPRDVDFQAIFEIEQDFRDAIFELLDSRYVRLIFQINSAFSHGQINVGGALNFTPEHQTFVRAWKIAKQIELTTLTDGNPELAAIAARQSRNIWQARVTLPAAI